LSAPGTEKPSVVRKPLEGECPICFCDFRGEGEEGVVWCRAQCGANVHGECWKKWRSSGPGPAKCVMCRQVWEDEGVGMGVVVGGMSLVAEVGEEGYLNVARQLGINQDRDLGVYRRRGRGWYNY